jgi:ABC-type multidrug transport system fused ATPase/permease subunit
MTTSLRNPNIPRKMWSALTSGERRSAGMLLGLMFIGMMLETLGAGLVIPAVALFTKRDLASSYPALEPALQALGNPSPETLVIAGMVVLAVVYLIKALFLAFLTWRQMRFVFGVQVQLSQRLFMAYLRQPYTFHLQRNSAQLIRNVTGEVSIFVFQAVLPMFVLLTEVLVFLGLCGLLLVMEPVGTAIVVIILGTAAWGFVRLTRLRVTRWGEARQHHDGLRIQHLQEGLGGAKDVKLLGRETDFLEQYRMHNAESARAGQFLATLQQLPRLWLELLAITGLAILVISMLAQGRALDALLPTLGLFAAAAFRLMPSVNRVLTSVQSLRYALPVIHTVHAELKLTAPETAKARVAAMAFREELKVQNITYTYPGAHDAALKQVSLFVRCGESVGIIGGSGAGKTTLVDILLGLLTPDSGEVLVDRQDIQHALRGWQDQIGYVPQSIFLTDDSLIRNVAFGLPRGQIDTAAVWRAIRAAQLEEFVQSLPQGLDTMVGERGVRLSGGQRQRIGIARALYHDPAILVLDEATSSLDTATERDVMQAVRALHGAKTTLIVAHRLSTVQHCDRLYRLEHGEVVQEGTPETMLVRQASAWR